MLQCSCLTTLIIIINLRVLTTLNKWWWTHMYKPIDIANYFLNKAYDNGKKLTPMKLIKLVYLAHGWNLALTSKPLLEEKIVAWKYGPVIRSLYDEFKKFGNESIPKPSNKDAKPEINLETAKLLDKIWEVYGRYTAAQLSNLTHEEGSPWDQAWNDDGGATEHNFPISNKTIEKYYKNKGRDD